MTLVLTRRDLQPLVTDPALIAQGVQVIRDALLRRADPGRMSWLAFPGVTPGQLFNTLAGFTPDDGFYVRTFTYRADPAGYQSTGSEVQPALLFDPTDGTVLALMAFDDLNAWRTAAPVALAAQQLAADTPSAVGMLGSGAQARYQLIALRHAVPGLSTVRVYSRTPEHRQRYAEELAAITGLAVTAVDDPQSAINDADIVCHTAPGLSIDPSWMRPSALLASIVPNGVPGGLAARLIVPDRSGPEVRSSGWDPFPVPPSPAVGRSEDDIDATLVEVIRQEAPARRHPEQTVAYEQLGAFAWDAALVRWAFDWASERGIGEHIHLTDAAA